MSADEKSKALTLFDHVKAVTQTQDPNYWDKLSDGDKKTWSNYMILRFISMKYDWLPLISELQPLVQELPPKQMYLALIDLLPKGKEFLRYIKGRKVESYPDWLIDCFCKYYNSSKNESVDYLHILHNVDGGHAEIQKIAESFGTDPKMIKKLKLKV